jgi:hypothetical protein
MTEDGSQSARKGQPLFLVDRNLGDSLKLIFNGIFNRDDLVFRVPDLHDRAVQRRRLAASVGPVTRTIPYGLLDVPRNFFRSDSPNPTTSRLSSEISR